MIEIIPYRTTWPETFQKVGATLREALGATALAIHHIGSTSVPGLAAKDIIDVQVSVSDLGAVSAVRLEAAGFRSRPDIVRDHMPPGLELESIELEKRYFQNHAPAVHLHVRVEGRFNGRYALLCRDYLRTHPLAASAYAEIKQQLATHFPEDADAYYAVKDPVFDVLMAGANEWAVWTAWQSPATDA